MRYAIKFHDISGEWLVFDIGDGFELVGMHMSEEDAVYQAMRLEETARKRTQWSSESIPQAA